MFKFSLIVCCYNSEDRIVETLGYISRCSLPLDSKAEVILVNNNCTDNTCVRAQSCWNRVDVPLMIITESRPGLSFAREAGMLAATGEIFVLVDDDNLLERNYLNRIHQVFEEKSSVGICGGVGHLRSDLVLPDWIKRFQGRYALGPFGTESGYVDFIYGAGMAIRREVIVQLRELGFQSQLTDRAGVNLSSGGDSELCFVARLIGWRVWRENAATFIHALPADRFTELYLIRLTKGIGSSIPKLSVYSYVIRFRYIALVHLVSLLAAIRSIFMTFYYLVLSSLNHQVIWLERYVFYSSVCRSWLALFLGGYFQLSTGAIKLAQAGPSASEPRR